ncbi:MAG TPA: hypothetical protein VHL57_10985, partial [Flavobacteriales bacterium]|nr:hypothetical protein [Flavobacteriales bacterium]
MKRVLLCVVGAVMACWAQAQTYGNEWIDHAQRYWSFPIVGSGVYRIDSTALANAGFPVTTVDPQQIRIYGRQRQVPIYIQGEADGVFNSADVIEFYAKGNDAWLDSSLWDTPSHMSNPYFSFYCDTINYFITF